MERLKQKVASSSSRVIASLQQAAAGNFPSSSSASLASGGGGGSSVQQQQQSHMARQSIAAAADSGLACYQEQAAVGDQPQSQQQQAASDQDSLLPTSTTAAARLMATEATAHLTESEREILLKVFKKEEQFQRDTIKQMKATQVHATTDELLRRVTAPSRHTRPTGNGRESASSAGGFTPSSSMATNMNSSTSASNASATPCGSSTSAASTCTFASARSATPLSRPSSSLFGGTPTQQQHLQHRAASSCSGSQVVAGDTGAGQQQAAAVGQCRICRKLILANETCHLCSTCGQFICEDCGSYSASEQHWMCSSCRRRATKPAIPDDALRELGLNQNSSAVRRMTLRLNQNELKLALGKCSSESTTSSNSSSGCSSLSAATAATNAQTSSASRLPGSRRASQQPQPQQKSAARSQPPGCVPSGGVSSGQTFVSQSHATQNKDQCIKQCDTTPTPAASVAAIANSTSTSASTSTSSAVTVHSTHLQQQQQQQYPDAAPPASGQWQSAGPGVALSNRQVQQQHQQEQQQHQQEQQQMRRASLASSQPVAAPAAGARKMSTAFYTQNSTSKPLDRRFAALNQRHQFVVQHKYPNQQPQRQTTQVTAAGAATAGNESPMSGSLRDLMIAQQQARRDSQMSNTSSYYQRQPLQQQQLMGSAARLSQSELNQQSVSGGTMLIPIPPDQIHLRRLSDQSNLVRRSSIIADTIDSVSMARNRSHSNIDTVCYSNYLLNQQSLATGGGGSGNLLPAQRFSVDADDPTYLGVQQQQQQRRPSDQWVQQQRMSVIQQQSELPRISSIITPYAQKRQPNAAAGAAIATAATAVIASEEGLHSDSSSDIEEPADNHQVMIDGIYTNHHHQHQRAVSSNLAQHNQSQLQQQQQARPISIPSVSVSEFNNSSANGGSARQAAYCDNQIIMSNPMQINVAIEQAIQRQQQQELDPYQTGYLVPRRGSSGRVLPKIPQSHEQSRSLLDLGSAQHTGSGILGHQQQLSGLNGGSGHLANGLASSTLDLPANCVRRASAPEGQNIKIVVDDIDVVGGYRLGSNGALNREAGSRRQSGQVAAGNRFVSGSRVTRGGELLERLVLYRDESLDPSTNLARGFGLQVMGGKIVGGSNNELPPNHHRRDSKRDVIQSNNSAYLPQAAADAKQPIQLQACVSWVLPGGPADKVGLEPGDQVIEWDGKCLVNMTYEQVADVIESSANIAELLVKPARKLEVQPGAASYVRSQRRLSQQTERDMRRLSQVSGLVGNQTSGVASSHTSKHQPDSYWPNTMVATSEMHCRSTGQLHHSAAEQRVGTGRRLPQIPGLVCAPEASSSTTQLADQRQLPLQQQQGYHLLPDLKQQVQSRSTGDMYPAAHSANPLNALPYGGSQTQLMYQQVPLIDTTYNADCSLDDNGTQNGYSSRAPRQVDQQQFSGYSNALSANSQYHDQVSGLIGLQVSVDDRVGQLEISILSAINIDRDPSLDYYVRVKILPESNRYKACTTQPSCDMNWKETFIFQNFPTEQINRMALEIGIWVYDDAPARLSTQVAQPICEALIPIQSARERNTDFWPLRPPPTSPQARRKSLNDLVENHRANEKRFVTNNEPYYSAHQQQLNHQRQVHAQPQPVFWPDSSQRRDLETSADQPPALSSRKNSAADQQYTSANYKAKSASNRNLPSGQQTPSANNKLRAQPRRASDEVAGSSSHRLSARVSPAASRRSISVINVGDGSSALLRPSTKLASSVRRDSNSQHQASKYTGAADSQVTGVTPSGRRSSLVGIQSMTGYRSQKNSQSGSTTDTNQDSPLRSVTAATSVTTKRPQSSSSTATATAAPVVANHRTPASASYYVGCGSPMGAGSRRGSTSGDQHQPPSGAQTYQRKGSLAMQTLRKLKRTMSLTKGSGEPHTGADSHHQSAATSTQGSRRTSSSSSSNHSLSDLGEDVGLARRLVMSAARNRSVSFVGKLKLSFIMTKGQLEIEVISAQGLRNLAETRDSGSLGIYVKMYLLGAKSKSGKRKTRTVQASETPVFKQLVKYDGSLVDNKTLEVGVWQKLGGLKGKLPIGFTEINLNELNLEQLQISWYNLRPMDLVCSSSVDDS